MRPSGRAPERGRFVLAPSEIGSPADRVAHVIVPALADWCVVDLVEGEFRGSQTSVRRAAAIHADPQRQLLVDELSRRYPPRGDRPTLSAPVIETGRSIFVHEVSDEMIDSMARDKARADLVRRIGIRSYMVAPLLARDRLLGVAAFLAEHRRFDGDDLPLAEELARRIGMAVDNARLFDQARAAADRMSRLQSVTAALARAVTAEQVAEVVIREAVDALHAADGLFCLTSGDGAWLEIVRSVGLPDSIVREWRRFAVEGPFPLSEAVRTREPVFLTNRAAAVARYPELREANARAIANSWIALPLTS